MLHAHAKLLQSESSQRSRLSFSVLTSTPVDHLEDPMWFASERPTYVEEWAVIPQQRAQACDHR